MNGSTLELLQAMGLPPDKASAALHYLADHLAHHLKPSPEALPLFRQAFRCGVHACCDALRQQAGDQCTTAQVGELPAGPIPPTIEQRRAAEQSPEPVAA
jgi:hypothetical protein